MNLSNNTILLVLTCICFIFFILILPYFDNLNNSDSRKLKEDFQNLNFPRLDQNICSKQCCKFTQWELPFNTVDPKIKIDDLKDYIGTNLSCNGSTSGGGCLCVKKSEYDYLSNRGQNKIN